MSAFGELDRIGRSQEDIRTAQAAEWGSKDLLAALWRQHPHILRRLTGKETA